MKERERRSNRSFAEKEFFFLSFFLSLWFPSYKYFHPTEIEEFEGIIIIPASSRSLFDEREDKHVVTSFHVREQSVKRDQRVVHDISYTLQPPISKIHGSSR